MSNKAGEILGGKYELVRAIGIGSSGTVWEGRHTQLGRQVAIKLLRPELTNDHEALQRFLREAQAAAGIGSEYIAAVTDVGQTDKGVPFLVMEYLEGNTLARAMREQRQMDPGRAASIAVQLCRALAAAHDKGIIHRDMKPDNIFLVQREDSSELVKVLDFGIAKIQNPSNPEVGRLTQSGTTLGTPYYMAPEQARAEKDLDHRVDVYSVGVVLYEMVTGKVPFSGASFSEIIIAATRDQAAPPRQHRPDLPEELEAIIQKAMARDRDVRYATARELAEVLEPFAALLPTSRPSAVLIDASGPTKGPPTAIMPKVRGGDGAGSRSRLLLFAGIGAALLLVLLLAAVIGGYLLYQSGVEAGAAQSGSTGANPAIAPPPVISTGGQPAAGHSVTVEPHSRGADGGSATPTPGTPADPNQNKPPDQPDGSVSGRGVAPGGGDPGELPSPFGVQGGHDPSTPVPSPFEAEPAPTPEETLQIANRHLRRREYDECLDTLQGSATSPRVAELRARCYEGVQRRPQACAEAQQCVSSSRWCDAFVRRRCLER